MKLKDAIYDMEQQLSSKYRDVKYESAEKVKMTKNSTESSFMSTTPSMDIEVERIADRFAIEGLIYAIRVNFQVKLPRKKKHTTHYEHYKIV